MIESTKNMLNELRQEAAAPNDYSDENPFA